MNDNGCDDNRCKDGCVCPLCGNKLKKGIKVCCGIWHIEPISDRVKKHKELNNEL